MVEVFLAGLCCVEYLVVVLLRDQMRVNLELKDLMTVL